MKTLLILFSDTEAVSARFLHYTTCIIRISTDCFGDVLQSDCWCSDSGRHAVSPLSAELFSIFPSRECVSPPLKGSCGFTVVQDFYVIHRNFDTWLCMDGIHKFLLIWQQILLVQEMAFVPPLLICWWYNLCNVVKLTSSCVTKPSQYNM